MCAFERSEKGMEFNMEKKKSNGKHVASLVLGICSLSFGTILLPIIGLVLSVKSRNELKEQNESNEMVTAGLVLNIIGLVKGALTLIGIMFWIMFVMFAIIADSSTTSYTYDRPTTHHGPSSSYYSYY